MLSNSQHDVLFWIVIGFFTVIGILALLTILGIFKTNKQFRAWAVTGFVTGIAGVVFVWAKNSESLDFYIILKPPSGIEVENFILQEGRYEFWDSSDSKPLIGNVELTEGGELGSWQAKFPCKIPNRSVKVTVKDHNGDWYTINPFYPNYNTRSLIKTSEPENKVGLTFRFPLMIQSAYAQETGIKFDNYATETLKRKGKNYFKWRIFVNEPDSTLDIIKEVQYLLNPAYPEPFQIRNNREDHFALEMTGWIQSWIEITVKFKNDSTAKTRYHLDFSKQQPPNDP